MIPVYLREKKATHLISPAAHNALDAFRSTQCPRPRFCLSKGSPRGEAEDIAHKRKWVPGPGSYDIKAIDKAWKVMSSSPTRSKRH